MTPMQVCYHVLIMVYLYILINGENNKSSLQDYNTIMRNPLPTNSVWGSMDIILQRVDLILSLCIPTFLLSRTGDVNSQLCTPDIYYSSQTNAIKTTCMNNLQ